MLSFIKMSPKSTITVVGSLNVDYVTVTSRLPHPGETFKAISFAQGFGGKGANQAIACARLSQASASSDSSARDVTVRMCGYVGDDGVGQDFVNHLQKNGLDVANIKVVEGKTTGSASITVVKDSGENCIMIVGGANEEMNGEEDYFHEGDEEVTKVSVFQLESPLKAVLAHIKKQDRHRGGQVR
jgi:ribokinase